MKMFNTGIKGNPLKKKKIMKTLNFLGINLKKSLYKNVSSILRDNI